MGGAVGGAVFKQVLVAFRDEQRMTELGGYTTIWAISIALFLLTALMMATVELPEKRKQVHE